MAVANKVFEGTFCRSIFYRITFKREDIDLDALIAASGASPNDTARVLCSSGRESTDFYIRGGWRVDSDEDELVLSLEFKRGYRKPLEDEKEPWAEDFLLWFARFIKRPNERQIHMHGQFEYPTQNRQSRFLLPLRVSIGPDEAGAEIDGISFRFSSRPSGISKVWLDQQPETISVYLVADKTTSASAINPRRDIEEFAGVLDTVLEEKKS